MQRGILRRPKLTLVGRTKCITLLQVCGAVRVPTHCVPAPRQEQSLPKRANRDGRLTGSVGVPAKKGPAVFQAIFQGVSPRLNGVIFVNISHPENRARNKRVKA